MTKWDRLNRVEPRTIVVLGIVQFGLQAAALWNLGHRSAADVRGPRWLWAVASFINFFGPLAYFAVGRRRTPRP